MMRHLLFIMSFCVAGVGAALAADFAVVNNDTDVVERYTDDGATPVWSTATGYGTNIGLRIGPDGNVYVGGWLSDSIKVFNGQTGAAGGTLLDNSIDIVRIARFCFGPDIDGDGVEDLYTAEGGAGETSLVRSWTSTSGYTELGSFDASGLCSQGAWACEFGPDMTGDGRPELYLRNGENANFTDITVADGATGEFAFAFTVPEVVSAKEIRCGSDGRIYISSSGNASVVSYLPDGTDPQVHNYPDEMTKPVDFAEGESGVWYLGDAGTGSVTRFTDNFSTFDGTLVSGLNYSGIDVFSDDADPEGVITVYSLPMLLTYLSQSDVEVKLAPGTYTINAADIADGTFGTPRFVFSGNNSTYDFTGVTINFAADVYTAGHGMDHLQILGNENILKNLTMVDQCEKYVVNKKEGGTSIVMDGRDNRIEGFHMTVRGSYPYGYGDSFGKGGTNNIIGHKKHSAFLVRGLRNHAKDCTILHQSYGHAIFMQAAESPVIEGCYVEGEVRTTDDMLAEEGTGSPADNVDFMTTWGYRLPPGYMMSTGEAGIRAYNAGTTYIDGVEYQRGTSNPTVLNCTVKYMRTGVTIAHATGTKYVEGCVAIGCENGYSLGTGTVVDCSADCTYGPVYSSTYESDKNYNADITILPASDPYYNGSQTVAYIGGSNHNITLRSSESSIGEGLTIKIGGDKQSLRHLYGNLDYQNHMLASNCVIENFTNYPVVLSSAYAYDEVNPDDGTITPVSCDGASGCTGQSCGPITDNGSGNNVERISCDYSDNVALNGVATQRSTDYEGVASRAIDGNTSGVWADGSVTHTDPEQSPHWWQVDLGRRYAIEEIQIFGRTDSCCQARLSNYDVTILSCNGAVVWSNYQADYPAPSVFLDAAGTLGRYVKVQLRDSANALSLAEVRVLSAAPAEYCGDLTSDGKVDMDDAAELSDGWQSGYTMDDLLHIANDWLSGTNQ